MLTLNGVDRNTRKAKSVNSKLRILHLEDVYTDAILVSQAIKKGDIDFEILVVDTRDKFIKALNEFSPDLILADHSLPSFNSIEALQLFHENGTKIPFILVTAAMSDEFAVGILKKGADDYILKDRLSRLPTAVNNSLEKFRLEKEREFFVNELVKKEKHYRALVENSADAVVILNSEGKPTYASPAVHRVLGYTVEEVLEMNILDLMHPDDLLPVTKVLEQVLANPGVTIQGHTGLMLHKDGRWRWIEATATNMLHDPAINGIIDNFRDITERKLAEEEIVKNEHKFRTLIEDSADGMAILSADGRPTYVSPSIKDILGYTVEEAMQLDLLTLAHPEDASTLGSMVQEAMTRPGLSVSGSSTRMKHKDGSWQWIEGTITNLLHDPAICGIVDNFRNITERKQAELLIRESEEKYRSFFENSMDGILLTVTDGQIFAANPAACAIFEMTEEEICAAGRLGLVDILDLRVEAAIEERRLTGLAKAEITLKRKSGHKFPGEVSSVVYTNSAGQQRTSMIVRDLTERKKAEEDLFSTSVELKKALTSLEKIMDSSVDIICSIDGEGRFASVSAASGVIWGYTPFELKGKHYIDLVFSEDAERSLQAAAKVVSGKPVAMFENQYVHKSGKVIPMLWSARWDDNDKLMYCIAKDATEKKRLEKTVESERHRFLDMFLQAPSSIGILKGPDHIFEMVNPLYLQLIGKQNIVGKTVREVLPEVVEQGFIEILDTVYKTGRSYTGTEVLVQFNKNNAGKLTDAYVNFIYQAYTNANGSIDGIFFFAVDVSEQVLSRRKIEKSEYKYRQIVETAQEGIWLINEKSETTFVNQKLCETFGYAKEEMMGKEIYDFMDGEGKEIASQIIAEKKEGKAGQAEFKYLAKNGSVIWTNVSANPIFDETGTYCGALAMITDITSRKEQELEIKKNAAEREVLIRELSKSLKDLKEFSYITSHNFRAPLSNLIGLLSLVDYSTLGKANTDIVEMFKTSTLQLNKTINDLIQILIIRNNVNINVSQNNISLVLNEVKNFLIYEINESKCIIKTDLQVALISFNHFYLESILINLLSNAIKYRAPNRPLEINISTRLNGDGKVLLAIEDNGIGIDLKRHRTNIFGLYQRFHSTNNGDGLGLFIVKSQITALGGTIYVESEVDKGTSFVVTFKD